MMSDPHRDEGESPPDILTAEEVMRLVGACSRRASSGLRNRALITVLYRGGLRLSEALRLELADLDADERLIALVSHERERSVGLDAGSFRVIERWIERRRETSLPDTAPLFCTLSGNPISSSYVRALLHRLADKAGVDKRVSAEVLRRSLAVELVEEGFSLVAIQAQLGHSAAAVTSRYLARLDTGSSRNDLRRRSEWCP